MDRQEVLREVHVLQDENVYGPIAIKLCFEVTEVYLVVNPDDDTVVVTSDTPTVPDCGRWIDSGPSWLEAIGRRLQVYKHVDFNLGLWDAIQLEFTGDTQHEASVIIQLEAAASSFLMWRLVRVA